MARPRSNVRHIRIRRAAKAPHNIPEPFPLSQLKRLLELAAWDGFTYEETRFAARTVRLWAGANSRRRSDWVMVVVNSMRHGWGLKGFEAWKRRTAPSRPPSPGRHLTPDFITRVLQHYRDLGVPE